MASSPITSWQTEEEKVEAVTDFIFLGSKITADSDCNHEMMGPDAMTLVFECLVLSQCFHSPLSPSKRGSLVPLHFLPLEWYHLHI